ncbi:MAG: plasmid stabilization system [Dehalococcoidia bacterium]|nr:plasmid stabilization system [Dehalococcoidia bacterium]
MFRIVFSNRADRALDWFDTRTAQRIIAALDALSTNPFFSRDVRKLRGELEGKYRLRVGRIRIVYEVLEEEAIIRVDDIAHRGSIY